MKRPFSNLWRWISRLFTGLLPGYARAPGVARGAVKRKYNARSPRLALFLVLLVVTTGVASLATWYLIPGANQEQLLARDLERALSAADYANAHRLVTTMLHARPDADDYLWCRASIEDQLHQKDKAEVTRFQLAKRGYGPAVLWLVDRDYPIDEIPEWSEQQHRDFVMLLADNPKWSPTTQVERNKRLAAYWTLLGQLRKAIESLKAICQWRPDAHVSIALLHLRLNDRAQAETHAKIARTQLQARLEEEPKDAEARLQFVRALMMLSCEEEALVSLADGYSLTRQPAMQQAAGEVLVSWARRLQKTDGTESTFWPRLQLIHRATQCAPNDALVLQATIDLIEECQTNEAARILELREATVRGIERIAAHSMLGWLSVWGAREQQALQHLKLAMADSPEVPTVLNNLALSLLSRSHIAPEKALMTIDMAMKLLPNQPQFAETRGRVMMAMDGAANGGLSRRE